MLNKPKELCCIVIPVYKDSINDKEIKSLRQVLRVLKRYKIYFAAPNNLNITKYLEILHEFPNCQFSIVNFDNRFFKSTSSYNKLLISRTFYTKFNKYEYMLIYQLDCWVFKDELNYWCGKKYDYIGAPWFFGMQLAMPESQFMGVGNGGFSIRRISSHIRVLKSFKYIIPFNELWESFIKKITARSAMKLLLNLTIYNNTFSNFNNYNFQEDYFWGCIVSKRFSWYKIPNEKTALRFSMEVNAPLLYKLNNNELPFGCHAWEKYNLDFWLKHIKL
jgi:hypothetical protein